MKFSAFLIHPNGCIVECNSRVDSNDGNQLIKGSELCSAESEGSELANWGGMNCIQDYIWKADGEMRILLISLSDIHAQDLRMILLLED